MAQNTDAFVFIVTTTHLCTKNTQHMFIFSSGAHMVAINNKGDDPIITETCVANLKSIKMIVSFPKASNQYRKPNAGLFQ